MSNLNYVSYDFDDLLQQIIDRIKANDSWKDAYRSGTGQMLAEFYAYVANLVLYYIERRAEETYIQTAQNRSSIINLVRLLNYIPSRKVSATGVVTFTIPTTVARNIYINKYTILKTADLTKFVVAADAVIMAGATSVDVAVIQGEKIEQQIVSSGTINQEYTIADTAIENSNLLVYVNNELWESVTSFLYAEPTSKQYKLVYNLDDTITIQFGDNVKGKSPAQSDVILIRYIRTDGVDGNVYSSDLLTTIESTIYDADGLPVTDVTVTNADVILGGDDEQTIEEIRDLAPRVFASGDRAITREDYAAILDSYPSVASSNEWGENEEDAPNYDMFNRVKICIILQDWVLPGTTFKATLSEYLYTKSQITVKYTYIAPDIVEIIPTLDVTVSDGYELSAIQSNIETALSDLFALGSTTKLGLSKRYSDIVYAIDDLDGVSYHHLTMEIYQELESSYDSFYGYGQTLQLLSVKASSVRVFVNDTQVAVDDGAGSFTDQSSAYAISGDINYTTGYVGIDISPALGASDTLYVRYQQDENGDLLVSNNQICKLRETDITSIGYES